jgi:hypothetical protein
MGGPETTHHGAITLSSSPRPKKAVNNKANNMKDNQKLIGAKNRFGHDIPIYDDGFGPLWIHRDSMGISGIVRAQTWEDAYEICKDEFFPSADDEAFTKSYDEMTDHERACWDESYGYRPNGRGGPTPDKDKGIYAKDLNGDSLDKLTPQLIQEIEITLQIENEE